MSVQHHVIRREVLNAALEGTEADGFALHRRLAALCNDWFAPALEDALSRIAPADEHWIVERLEVDAGSFTPELLERDFVNVVAAAVERQIRERTSAVATARRRAGAREDPPAAREAHGAILRLSGAQSIEEALAYFLATGALPWWFSLPAGEMLESVATAALFADGSSAYLGARLIEAIAAPAARMRLVRQFSTRFVEMLLERLSPRAATIARAIEIEIARLAPQSERRRALSERLWSAALALAATRRATTMERLIAEWARAFSPDDEPERSLIFQIARLFDAPLLDDQAEESPRRVEAETLIDSPLADEQAEESSRGAGAETHAAENGLVPGASSPRLDLEEGVFVTCAGIVLLNPFLATLLERLGIAAEGTLLRPDRALGILHFLATGERRAPEHAIVLAKLLCGLPLEEPCGAPFDLADDEAAEANALLEAVISHWNALGGASPDALRGTFLTRPGKLSRRGEDDLLQVEPHSFDLLLDRLPWGIGVIRLPWMRRMLWVEWRM
jgi:hypothetical protein